MESLVTLETLRGANLNLRAGISRLREGQEPVHPEELASILAELVRAADTLRSIAPGSTIDAELEREIADYRANVQQLAEVMPSLYGRLLAEKSRLEQKRTRLETATAWAKSEKITF